MADSPDDYLDLVNSQLGGNVPAGQKLHGATTPAPAPPQPAAVPASDLTSGDPYLDLVHARAGADEIEAAAAKRQAENQAGGHSLGGVGDYVLRGIQSGYENALGLPGDLQQYALAKLPSSMVSEPNIRLPTSADLAERDRQDMLRNQWKFGEATTPAGRIGQAGIASLFGGPEGMGIRAVSGMAGQSAAEVTNNNPIATLGAGLLAGGFANAGAQARQTLNDTKTARRDFANATGVLDKYNEPVAATAFKQGQGELKDQIQQYIEDRGALDKKMAEAAHTQAVAAAEQAHQQTQQWTQGAVTSQAKRLGQSTDVPSGGEAVQDIAHKFVQDEAPKQVTNFYAPLDSIADPDKTFVDLTPYKTTAQDIADKPGPEIKGQIAALGGRNLGDRVIEEFNKQAAQDKAREALALPAKGPPSVAQVRELKTFIGGQINNPTVLKDIPDQQLRRLYGSVNDSMRNAYGSLDGVGDQAVKAFDEANGNTEALKEFMGPNGALGKIIASGNEAKESTSPVLAVNRIMRLAKSGDPALLELRQRVPQLVDESAAALLHEDPDLWGKLHPKGQEALVADPAVRQNLDQLQTIRDDVKSRTQDTKTQAKAAKDQALEDSANELKNWQRDAYGDIKGAKNAREMAISRAEGLQQQSAPLGGPKNASAKSLSDRLGAGLKGLALSAAAGGGISNLAGTPIDLQHGIVQHLIASGLMGGALSLAGGPVVNAALGGLGSRAALQSSATTAGGKFGNAAKKKGEE